MIVTGPSFTRATFMSAPKTPVSTCAPSLRNSATTAPTSGSATWPGAALIHVGRRPLVVSAYNVNWLTTSNGAAVSEQDFSPSRMRSPQSLAASFAALAGVSSWVTPTSTSRPGSAMAPTTRPSTVTLARLTRCTTARTTALPSRRARHRSRERREAYALIPGSRDGQPGRLGLAGQAAWARCVGRYEAVTAPAAVFHLNVVPDEPPISPATQNWLVVPGCGAAAK